MSRIVIQVEGLGKLYRLGEISTGMVTHDLKRWWARMRGQEDPFMKIGTENDRTQKNDNMYAWALKDVHFEIKEGEAVGIIGKNGAGKSTLLKLLSKVTSPTTGSIKVKGRIASLLEVGTGFHPELTGRENIYLNGAILGMTKREITSKFDEIVDFSGVERYIDTPVKRYSSGMYVRLAFAVAAHLEPEILIVDEVLAVGDSEFQKKCLGKMKDVSGRGRTVIFVSHNMTAIQSLCESSILMDKGSVELIGTSKEVIEQYLKQNSETQTFREWDLENAPGDETAKIIRVELVNSSGGHHFSSFLEEDVFLEVTYQSLKDGVKLNLSISITTDKEDHVLNSPSITDEVWCGQPHPAGIYKSVCKLPANFFNDIVYRIHLLFVKDGALLALVNDAVNLQKIDSGINRKSFFGTWNGMTRPILEWRTSKLL